MVASVRFLVSYRKMEIFGNKQFAYIYIYICLLFYLSFRKAHIIFSNVAFLMFCSKQYFKCSFFVVYLFGVFV
jgi:hypothetical protein